VLINSGGGGGGSASTKASTEAAKAVLDKLADRKMAGGSGAWTAPRKLASTATSEPGKKGTAPAAKSSSKGGSTTVAVDDTNQTVKIKTKMEFTGPDATPEYAAAAKKQIEETWSGTMMRNGKSYKVTTEVETSVNKSGKPTPGFDQILVDKKNTRMSQTLYGSGPGYQTPDAATDAGRPRRIAHEYGHTLGLNDQYGSDKKGNYLNLRPDLKNNIMAETWPDDKGRLPVPQQEHYVEVLKKHGW
jgi:hypothetical protein